VRVGVATEPAQVAAAQTVPAASAEQVASPNALVQVRHLNAQAAPQHTPSTQ
jgi:hypothetical protein